MASTRPRMFTYAPLNRQRNEIRLLRLLPSADPTAPVECQLVHTPLDDKSHYEALSYTWGGNERTDSIKLDGFAFLVTGNLFSALQTLRIEDKVRHIWIDAICINQDDIFERNEQVLRMLSIYKQAEQVVVWLGEESDDSSLALIHLLKLSSGWHYRNDRGIRASAIRACGEFKRLAMILVDALLHIPINRPIFVVESLAYYTFRFFWGSAISSRLAYITLWTIKYGILLSYGLAFLVELGRSISWDGDKRSLPRNREVVLALTRLFTRPWWRRVWIVQEIAVARRAVVMCGEAWITWSELLEGVEQISVLVTRSTVRNPYIDTHFRQVDNMRQSLNIRNASPRRVSFKRSLQFLLRNFGFCDATDPRDKVYGLLGLASELQESEIEGFIISPDYSHSIGYTYAELTKFLVLRTGRLDILHFCEGSRKMPADLPSWAPDWTYNAYHAVNMREPRPKCYELPVDTASMTKHTFAPAAFSAALTTMNVRGFTIGHVTEVGEALMSTGDKRIFNHPIFDELEFRDQLDTFLRYLAPPFRLLIRPGLAGLLLQWAVKLCVKYKRRNGASLSPWFEVLVETMKDWAIFLREGGEDCNIKIPICLENFSDTSLLEREERLATPIVWEPVLEHSIVLGNDILTIANPHVGDVVCMLVGAIEPFLLRKSEGHYIVVGPFPMGFYDRIVWRECVEARKNGELMLQEFELR